MPVSPSLTTIRIVGDVSLMDPVGAKLTALGATSSPAARFTVNAHAPLRVRPLNFDARTDTRYRRWSNNFWRTE